MLRRQYLFRQQYSARPDRGETNLFATPNETAIDGAFTHETRRTSVYTKSIELHPAVRRAVMAALAIGGAWLLSRRLRGGRG